MVRIDPPEEHEVVDDAKRLLARWRRKYAKRPDLEREHLWLLALEREQVVTVAYDEDMFATRLARLPVPSALREVIRHALAWIWKDEEIHTDFIRGLLLEGDAEDRGRFKSARVFAAQAMGAVAGWAAATRLHNTFAEAPLSVAAASLVTLGGRATRKLSESMQRELAYGSFRSYCLLNIALEDSAALCYERMVEIAASDTERAAFEKIRDDEYEHADLFGVLADSIGPNDRLRDGVTLEAVVERVRGISEWLLPGRLRSDAERANAFATGGDVAVRVGAVSEDKGRILCEALEAGGLDDLVTVRRPRSVAIKTAFMMGYHDGDRSNVIDAELLGQLARRLREHGADDIAVLEAPTVYENWFANRDVHSVARYFGLDGDGYRIVDTQRDQVHYGYRRGMAQATISRTWRDADLRIVFAKMRTNPTERGHLCLSTLEGLGDRQDAFVFADRQLHYRAATMMMLDDFAPEFAIVDAYASVADGPFGVMGCRRPPAPHRIYAGCDALTVDAVAMRDMGVPDPAQSPMLRTAQHWFGARLEPARVDGPAGRIPDFRAARGAPLRALLAAGAYPVYVYGSAGGRLFTPAMDAEAFPLREPSPATVRLVRRGAQLAFGLRPGADG